MGHSTHEQVNSMFIASTVSGLDEEQISKTRDTDDGGMVVIDVTGNKHKYTSKQMAEAMARVVNGRRNLGAQDIKPLENYRRASSYGGKRAGSGRKPKKEGKRQRGTDLHFSELPQEDIDAP